VRREQVLLGGPALLGGLLAIVLGALWVAPQWQGLQADQQRWQELQAGRDRLPLLRRQLAQLEQRRELAAANNRQILRLIAGSGDLTTLLALLSAEAAAAGVRVSLATIYNTLNQFTAAGLLREGVVEAGRSYFDTNTTDHHHLLVEPGGELVDVPASHVRVVGLPDLPPDLSLRRVDVILRVARAAK
jgi:Fur family iron response transcriptional regulator